MHSTNNHTASADITPSGRAPRVRTGAQPVTGATRSELQKASCVVADMRSGGCRLFQLRDLRTQ